MKRNYQENYSNISNEMYEVNSRKIKANKTIKVLQDYLNSTVNLDLLDIGSSTGIMTNEYSKHFKTVTGIDIDSKAIQYAKETFKARNITFINSPIEEANFQPESFDVITCSHIYEHVPSSEILMEHIYKLLKPGGVCYFAAGNKFQIIEPHYKLPFLSYLPKKKADLYIKIFTNQKEYYEKHYSLKNLKKLTSKFKVVDYTLEIIKSPSKYSSTEMLKESTLKYIIINLLSKILYPIIPTYIWILEKPKK